MSKPNNPTTLSLRHSGKIRVLVYQRIYRNETDARNTPGAVNEKRFRQQIDFLDRWGFSSITFEDYRLALQGELFLPRKPVIITFDGGGQDTYKVAFPILQKYGMKAVVFAIANPDTPNDTISKGDISQAYLLREQILEMHARGFEIGAHPLAHLDLTQLTENEALENISRSRMLLEIILNAPVKSFSFPNGRLNNSVKRIVAEAGFLNACSTWTGPAKFYLDPYEIRRTVVSGTTNLIGFASRLLLPYEQYGWFLWRLGHLHE